MNASPRPSPATPDTTRGTAGADDPQPQSGLERAWRDRLLAHPSDAAFREAYDQVHAAMRRRPGRETLYEPSLTRVDRAFLQAAAGARRLLDVGAGNGRFALAAAAGRRVVAVDISGEALAAIQRARPPAPRNPQSAIRQTAGGQVRNPQSSGPALCQASALRLPFRAETFDAVVSLDLLEHLHPETLGQHLAEVHRVLSPGGRYLLHTPSALHGPTSLGLHLREYRLREVERAGRAAGFRPRWVCLNLARLGWTGTAPGWLWPALRAWEILWGLVGRAGLRRAAGRCYAAGLPDVDVSLLKSVA